MLTRAAARAGQAAVQSAAARSVSSGDQKLAVQHDTANCELFIEIPGSDEKAYLQYEHVTNSLMDLQHTVVPEAFRGRGVAKILAKAAFDYVIQHDKKMKLTCWYLRKFYRDNPSLEYSKRLVE